MKSAQDVSFDQEFLKVMLIGDAGTGKSVCASTFPTPGYVFDFDMGILTYRGLDFQYEQFPADGKSWGLFDKEFRAVEKMVAAGELKTVIIDSTTSMGDCAMERALILDPKRSTEGGPIWNVHYQIVKNLINPKLQRFKGLNCNVVLISHWKLQKDQKDGSIIGAKPLLTGDLAEKVTGYFDEVYCTFTQQKEGRTNYFLRLVNKGYFTARSRLSGKDHLLPDVLPNNYESIMEAAKKASAKLKGDA